LVSNFEQNRKERKMEKLSNYKSQNQNEFQHSQTIQYLKYVESLLPKFPQFFNSIQNSEISQGMESVKSSSQKQESVVLEKRVQEKKTKTVLSSLPSSPTATAFVKSKDVNTLTLLANQNEEKKRKKTSCKFSSIFIKEKN